MNRSIGRAFSGLAAVLAATLLFVAAPSAQAGDGFDGFCAEWMNKLAKREQQNLAKLQYSPQGGRMVGTYTGYERVPVRCQSRAKPGKPGVGTLVYHEVRYQKAGDTVERAKTSPPQVVEKTEVMEIFRFDGQKWKY